MISGIDRFIWKIVRESIPTEKEEWLSKPVYLPLLAKACPKPLEFINHALLNPPNIVSQYDTSTPKVPFIFIAGESFTVLDEHPIHGFRTDDEEERDIEIEAEAGTIYVFRKGRKIYVPSVVESTGEVEKVGIYGIRVRGEVGIKHRVKLNIKSVGGVVHPHSYEASVVVHIAHSSPTLVEWLGDYLLLVLQEKLWERQEFFKLSKVEVRGYSKWFEILGGAGQQVWRRELAISGIVFTESEVFESDVGGERIVISLSGVGDVIEIIL